jgi:acylphosphatase
VFAGPADTVASLIAACRQGPHGASVDTIEESDADKAALDQRRPGERFSVLPTG